MASEEAALRAKIQAMKNLLQAKQQQQQQQGSHHPYRQQHHAPSHHAQRSFPSARCYHAPPVNRSWNRFTSGAASSSNNATTSVSSASAYYGSVRSANKVWRKEDADAAAAGGFVKKSASTAGPSQPVMAGGSAAGSKTWKRPLKVAASSHKYQSLLVKRARSRMQLRVLKLEDGEYAKANGGFSLIRAGVKLQKPASALTVRPAVGAATPLRASNSVNIGGANYVVTQRGNSLKRMTVDEVNKSAAVAKQQSLSANSTSATSRAQAAVLRARNARLKKKTNAVRVRTEYCYCNKRNDCAYIHDSRRVAICRKFLRNECADANCLLSHKHDQNKMPVCALFLRGACTRDDCKYRHVKVSRSAQVCQAFLKGYCPDGAACKLKHELPPKKQSVTPTAAGSAQGKSVSAPSQKQKSGSVQSDTAEQENQSPRGTAPDVAGLSTATERSGASSSPTGGLSIRPNIRFRPKNASGFPSLFSVRSALSS